MNNLFAFVLTGTLTLSTTACASQYPAYSQTDKSLQNNIKTSVEVSADTFTDIYEENIPEEMNTILITVGDKTFTAEIYDNEAAEALLEYMPLSINMSELNGNEKYYYMDYDIPTNSYNPGNINTGDIMLYGSNCLVLFYEGLSNSYSYTPIGRIQNTNGLAEALGGGSVYITFTTN